MINRDLSEKPLHSQQIENLFINPPSAKLREAIQSHVQLLFLLIIMIKIRYWAKTAELIGSPGAYKYKYNNHK